MLRFARERFSLRRNRGISRVRRTSRGFFGPEFFQDGADVLPEIVSGSRPVLPQGMLELGERLPGRSSGAEGREEEQAGACASDCRAHRFGIVAATAAKLSGR